MLKRPILIYAALLGILAISGCTTFEKGLPQTVNVHSFPSGADVYVNGDYAGVTPYSMELRTKTITGVRIEKSGYQPRRFTIRPRPNADANDFVRFGILYDIGYYQDLVPNPVEVQLPPVGLPRSRSLDQYEEMTRLISQIDGKRERGEIDPVEHKYQVEKIIEFYVGQAQQ